MDDRDRLEVAGILGEASDLVGARVPTFLAATAVYVAAGTWADDQLWSWEMQIVMTCLPVLLGGLLQYLVLRRALGDGGGGWVSAMLAPLTAIFLQFAIWFVAGLGYLLLLVPGLYLAARMSAAIGMVVVERSGPIASIAGSWHRTRRSAWPLAAVHAMLLFPIVALALAMFAAAYLNQGVEYASLELRLVTNLVMGVVTMAGWAVAGAVYRLTAPSRGGPEDMFG